MSGGAFKIHLMGLSFSATNEEDDVLIVETEEDASSNTDDTEGRTRKRKLEEKDHVSTKRMRPEAPAEEVEDDVIALD